MITDVNPFVYSRPIAPDQIVDRDEETQLLLKNAVGGHYVRLYAPRKYGKTSLLQRALADGERQGGPGRGVRGPRASAGRGSSRWWSPSTASSRSRTSPCASSARTRRSCAARSA